MHVHACRERLCSLVGSNRLLEVQAPGLVHMPDTDKAVRLSFVDKVFLLVKQDFTAGVCWQSLCFDLLC